jgi:D-alanyl-D-alanine carboxypeptidase
LAAAALPAAGVAHAETKKSAVLVIDGNTGRVLHQSAADEPRHPASLAKMMTIYLAFELIEQGRLGYQTKIKFSANAAAAAPSKLDLEEGEEIALIDAIKVLITKSANDVAIAVAEHIAGSEEKFARLMTRKAHQLGMSATTFRNASGLPDDAQVTTARDMVTLALRLQDDFPKHYPLFATRTASYKNEEFRNHNTLLFHYEGTDGLKTGYTRASGSTWWRPCGAARSM